jgi:hypothetical protein
VTPDQQEILEAYFERLWTLVNDQVYTDVFCKHGPNVLALTLVKQVTDVSNRHVGEDVLGGMAAEDAVANELSRMQTAWAVAISTIIGHLVMSGSSDSDIPSL